MELNIHFHSFTQVETVNRDWSWRVRFAAVQGLVRVCRHCHGDSNKEGIRTVAWGALLKHHSIERDVRVLEALKVANVSDVYCLNLMFVYVNVVL